MSNAVTTTNVFASRYYGDGGLLSNVSTFIQPLANLVVSNAVTTTNVFANALNINGSVIVSNTITAFQTADFVSSTVMSAIVGGSKLISGTAASLLPVQTQVGTLPNFLAMGSSHFYFYDSALASRLTDPGIGAAELGSSIALSADGHTIVVGAPVYSSSTGWVGVWRYTNGSWGSSVQLSDPGLGGNTRLGTSVAISADGNTIVAGAPSYLTATGWVGVWRFINGSWGTATRLADPSLGLGGQIGYAVAISADGNSVASSAYYYPYPSQTGWVGVWRFVNGTWGSASRLPDPGLGTGTSLGFTVAMSADGNSVAAGASTYSGNTGWVGVWRFTNGSWGSASRLPDPGIGGGTYLGSALAMSADGNSVASGAYGYSVSTGWVGVWRYTSGTWGSASRLPDPGLGGGKFVGYTVSMSADGNSVTSGTNGMGWVGVWRYTSGSWGSASRLPDPGLGAMSAVAMSADGNSVASGANGYSGNTGWAGAWVCGARFKVNNTLNVYNGAIGVGTTTPVANLHIVGNVYASNAVTTTNVFAATATVTGTANQTTLNVTGNVYASNAVTTTNVFAATATVTGTANQTTLNVTGNVYASNAVTTTNIFAATATVTGNIYASNAITTTNLFANTLTMSNAVSTITVTGNIYASNAITTTNLFANTLTMSNAVSTITVTGNIYASNSVTTTNVFTSNLFVTGNTPVSNVVTIQQLGTGNVFSTSNASGQVGLFVSSTSNVGIGTTNPSSFTLQVIGTIGSTGDFTVYYSDDRLKTKTGRIENALEKVLSLEAFTYVPNELAKSFGFQDSRQRVGLSAQSVQKVLPEAVCPAPFDADNQSQQGYLTIQYEKIVPLLVEAIKELHEKTNMK